MAMELGAQFEQVLVALQGNGNYQRRVVFGVLLPTYFASSFLVSLVLFVIAVPASYWCRLPLPSENFSSLIADHRRSLLPPDKDGASFDKCLRYDVNYSRLYENAGSMETLGLYFNGTVGNWTTVSCDRWDYDRSNYHDTIVTDWDLVCGRDFMPTLSYILAAFGTVGWIVAHSLLLVVQPLVMRLASRKTIDTEVGTPIGGYLADLIGRKKTYLIMFFFQITFAAASAGSSHAPYGFWIYVVMGILQALAVNPTYLVPGTLGMEIVTPTFRATYMVLVSVAYTFGGLAVAGHVYAFRSWRTMTLIGTLPFFVFVVFVVLMPESPRWLLSKRRFEDLRKFFQIMAKVNGATFDLAIQDKFQLLCDESIKANESDKKGKQYSYLDLFRRPQIRKQTILMTVVNTVCALCYNGMSFYSPSLGTNPYLSFFLSSLVELPAALFTELICDRVGRRITIILCFVLGGTACIATLALPPDSAPFAGVLVLFLIAKLFITSAYIVQELMQNEMLPTVVRGKGVGLTNFVGSILTNIGPVVVYVGYSQSSLTLVIFGGIMIFASICAVFLPETLNCVLPETLEECEVLGKTASAWTRPCTAWRPKPDKVIQPKNS